MWMLPSIASARWAWLALAVAVAAAERPAAGLDPRRLPSQYAAQQWSTEHGLPDSYVQAIHQSRDGRLWLGTQNAGLVRFDGIRFQPVDPGFQLAKPEVSVRAICEAGDGTLWVATDGAGLWRLRGGAWSRLTRADGLPNDYIFALWADADGALWVAAGANSVVRLHEGVISAPLRLKDSPRQPSVYALHRDRHGDLWLAGQGLWRLRAGVVEDWRTRLGRPEERFFALAEAQDGSLWLASEGGLLRLADGVIQRHGREDGLADDIIRALRMDRDGVLWIGSNSGLDRHHEGRFHRFLMHDGTPQDLVYALFEDREGSLWVGSNTGLLRLREDRFAFLSTREGLPQNIVTCAWEARDGSLWTGTWSKGLARWQDGRVTSYTTAQGLGGDTVRSLHEDGEGVIWVGTLPAGVSRIRDGRVETLTAEALGGARTALAFASPAGGSPRIWMVSDDGRLLRWSGKELVPVDDGGSLHGQRVQTAHAGPGGALWLATDQALHRWRGEERAAFALPTGLAGRPIRSLWETRSGEVWVAAQDAGLARCHEGRWQMFSTADGLPLDNHYAVVEDAQDNLWVACKAGVFLLPREALQRRDEGCASPLQALDFTRQGGPHNPRLVRLGSPLAGVLRDGRLWFASSRGLALVDPARPLLNDQPPPVFIEEVLVDRLPQPEAAVHRLRGGARDLEIRYGAPSLRAPEWVQFRYRLAGYDTGWIPAGHRRTAHYQNLPPGRYVFHVTAANEDGVWNADGVSVRIEQRPQPHQSAWFYALGGGALLAGGWWLHRVRLRAAQRRFALILEERTRIARELHDTVEQGLVGATLQLSLAARQPGREDTHPARHLAKARAMLHHCLADMRTAVRDLRSQSDTGGLPRELHRLITELRGAGAPEIVLHPLPSLDALAPSVAAALLRLVQEALTNVLKHAQATRVEIRIVPAPGLLTLRVEDDGCGFDPGEAAGREGHYGLVGMRERVERLAGRLILRSAPGNGTVLEAQLPLRRPHAAVHPADA